MTTEPTTTATALQELVEAIAPLMDRDYCSPFTSAWELEPDGGLDHYDGEVIYEQVKAIWEQAKELVGQTPVVWAVGENDHGGTTYCLHLTEEAARGCLAKTRWRAADDVWSLEVWPDVDHG